MDLVKARKAMVDSQVRPNDVPDVRIQQAMETVPRELFVPANRQSLAYVEKDVPLFEGRWLLKARDFSKLLHAARIKETDLVLDVGCGLGYSTAIAAHLGSVVVGVEEEEDKVTKAAEALSDLGLDNAAVMQAPLADGVAKQGPYDVIVVAAGVEDNLDTLRGQLSEEGGRLVTIIVENGVGHATLITRHGDAFGDRRVFEAHPAGTLPGFEKTPAFVF